MSKIFIISGHWNEQPWFSTGGTRAKKFLISPDGRAYYFKRSQYKEPTATRPGKDFKYEFWNEIIASEIGILLGFRMLEYNLAIDGEIMGCISESMINFENEELIEGVKYLQAFAPTYEPGNKEHHSRYTFQMIENSLEKAKLKSEINNIIELIVVDSLIGNGDRHQENWAMIRRQELFSETIKRIEEHDNFAALSRFHKWLIRILKWVFRNGEKRYMRTGVKPSAIYYDMKMSFAPIYDSGSSLGRELADAKVVELTKNVEGLNHYVERGLSEIHWEGMKVSHFKLIENLLRSDRYSEIVRSVINRVISKWNGMKIEEIIKNIDTDVPESHENYKIPQVRKELICKIITSRYNRLKALHERI